MADLSTRRQRTGLRIEGSRVLVADVTMREAPQRRAEVSDHEVEQGLRASDHVRPQPVQLQCDIVVTASPLAGEGDHGGPARLDGQPVMLIGHQKGRDTKERVRRNYGMPRPEGYRKALRLMKLAERFRLPIVTLIDTPGAYPGVGSEERNQSEAIARNLFEMATLRVPVITAVIGEGGSGGALAIGVCDRLIMLQYAVYSVISPEGCASILWKSADKKELAAEAMGITAERIAKFGLVDEIVKEPLGGAHRDPQVMADDLKGAILRHLREVEQWPEEQLLERRHARLRAQGVYRAG
jgi:acetyl-CoA carboxylase carboxyl transferase subunit alpha